MPNPPTPRHAHLFRNGLNQALRISREFELPRDVIIHKDGHRRIVEPVKQPNTRAELLASREPLDEEFPEIEDPPVSPRIYSEMAGPHYLLDTNVLSAVVKRPPRELARRIAAMNRGEYCSSIVVAANYATASAEKGSQGLAAKVEQQPLP